MPNPAHLPIENLPLIHASPPPQCEEPANTFGTILLQANSIEPHHLPTFEQISAAVTPDQSLSSIFLLFGLDLATECACLKPSSSQSIQELFHIHNAISLLLEKFGLPGFCSNPTARGRCNYIGGDICCCLIGRP